MTPVFLLICVAAAAAIFKTGYRLKSEPVRTAAIDLRQRMRRRPAYHRHACRQYRIHDMKAAAFLTILVCQALLALPAAADTPLSRPALTTLQLTPMLAPLLAQGDRCGPKPMKPSSCLSGSWVCRCDADGRNCRWELIGCSYPGSLPPRPGEPRPAPGRPGDPARPNLFGR